MTIQAFVDKYNAEVVCGNIIATVDGKRQKIGKLVGGNLVKLIAEDITPPEAKVEAKTERKPRRQKAKEEAEEVEVKEEPKEESAE